VKLRRGDEGGLGAGHLKLISLQPGCRSSQASTPAFNTSIICFSLGIGTFHLTARFPVVKSNGYGVAVFCPASRRPLLSPVVQHGHQMAEVNVRDEGFTVLSKGVEPVAESVIPPRSCIKIVDPHLTALCSSTAFRATQRRHGHTARKRKSPQILSAG
jgi:hypothetical protein